MESGQTPGWFKVAAIAAASALAGGLAAAWWYRKTLTSLRQGGESPSNPQFGIPGDDPADES
jgi:membrane associated rhomboid family serine protease